VYTDLGGTMGSLSRKMKRKKIKKLKKDTTRSMKQVSKVLDSMPKSCKLCQKAFDKTDIPNSYEWNIEVFDEGTCNLTCPECYKEIVT
jgi:hypothetical protein